MRRVPFKNRTDNHHVVLLGPLYMYRGRRERERGREKEWEGGGREKEGKEKWEEGSYNSCNVGH